MDGGHVCGALYPPLCSPVWRQTPVHQHLLVFPHDRTQPLLCNTHKTTQTLNNHLQEFMRIICTKTSTLSEFSVILNVGSKNVFLNIRLYYWKLDFRFTVFLLWWRWINVVGGLRLVVCDRALKRTENNNMKNRKRDTKEVKQGLETSDFSSTDKMFSVMVLTWCLLMVSLSLLACFCSMSGDKKTVGRVKQLFWNYRSCNVK